MALFSPMIFQLCLVYDNTMIYQSYLGKHNKILFWNINIYYQRYYNPGAAYVIDILAVSCIFNIEDRSFPFWNFAQVKQSTGKNNGHKQQQLD